MQMIKLLHNLDDHSLVFNYVLFYISVNFVNKYVLSVLRFTYPTIFQGWQVLAGAIILRILTITGQVNINVWEHGSSAVMSWCPAMIFYTFSIYTGSVALANLPIPIYFSVHCLVNAASFVIDYIHRKKEMRELVLVPVLVSSVFATVWTDPQFNPVAYKWAGSHVVFVVLYSYFEKTYGHAVKLGPTDRLFCNYVFSMVLLAPSSLLLGDIFAAQNFGFFRFYKFYAGCIASGVLGVLVSLHGIRIKEGEQTHPSKESLSSFSKIIAGLISLFLFNTPITPANLLCTFFTLGTNFLMHELSSKFKPATLLDSAVVIEAKKSQLSDQTGSNEEVYHNGHVSNVATGFSIHSNTFAI